jgi:IclR family transcriptional regulator, acetate operon repressor
VTERSPERGPERSRDGASPYSVRAVERVVDILDVLHDTVGGVTLAEVAKATGLPKASAFRYLSTLETRGYVERVPSTGAYQLGMAFVSSHGRQLDALAARARPILEDLRDRFEETVNLGVLERTRVMYLEIVESRRGMRFAARKGDREALHSSALGKAIAAQVDETRLRSILAAEGMPERTARTITDPDVFVGVVEKVRRAGYAIDDRENEEDGRCVAVPVSAVGVPAAISLSAPSARFSAGDAGDAVPQLQEAAARLVREFGGVV